MRNVRDYSALRPIFWGAVLLVFIALAMLLRPQPQASPAGATYVFAEAAR